MKSQRCIEVKRSPGQITWLILLNGALLGTRDTEAEANELRDKLQRLSDSVITA
ncbi:hypothetical protein [Pantoea phage LIMEzero]|uniref:Uncharacterized protein n=1 Tax=Pantoea phage LIMEzero TaxID=943335 RepID=F4N9R9_9CAUD|nr:hypothetical protein LIMEzero_ORF16 [Pantoea phage LIMEzero]CBY88547.1 hypothetical protein [Pantoea phage LIMEzero]